MFCCFFTNCVFFRDKFVAEKMSVEENARQLQMESTFYCSVLLKMRLNLPFFNNNQYWEICDIIRLHHDACDNVHSLIWGIAHFCDKNDNQFLNSCLIVIRGLYRRAIVAHGKYIRAILPFVTTII